MNLFKLLNHLSNHKFIRHFPPKVLWNSAYSIKLSKQFSTQSNQAEELVIKEKIQLTKPDVVQWKRPPFVKNFFIGKFDTELLAFPEILNNELLTEVEKYVKLLNEFYIEKVNSKQIDESGFIPNDLLQDFKDMGLFGRMIPVKYGGLGLSYTACTRLNEVIGLDWSLYSLLTVHEFLASRYILLFGTEEQKNKYLPLLASGKLIAAFCCSEVESGSDIRSIKTTADKNQDDTFTINGTKCWVSNAEHADVFIVVTLTQHAVDPHQKDLSIFIVDRDTEGITITPQDKICLRGLKTSMVTFKEVTVPIQNLIGEMGMGVPMYFKVLEGFRIAMNSFTFGTLKVLLDTITAHIIDMERTEQSVGDMQLVRGRLSRINCILYAMESMAYFTAAILDSTEIPDVTFESAIMKIFCTEGTLFCIRELMEVVGSSCLMKEHYLERFHRDALGLKMFDGPNDFARLYLGLSGCQLAGGQKYEDIMKDRNAFFFPKRTIIENIKRARHFSKFIKYDQDLAGYIHPSLVVAGNALEEKLQKFNIAVEDTLANHGKKVVETQLDPKKLADAAINLYAQSAVLSRSSRSYCIGLKNASHEVQLAQAFCHDSDQKLIFCLNDIFIGNSLNNEGHHLLLGEQVIDCKGYFPEHPLKHNF